MFGITKQAYYQRIEADKEQEKVHQIVLDEVAAIRKKKPQTGTRKLIEELQPALHKNKIKMGRDALFELLRYKGLLLRKTKRFHITTDSKHFYYTSPNRIKELEINHCEQVFVSDITYIKTDEGHAYLALVTDAPPALKGAIEEFFLGTSQITLFNIVVSLPCTCSFFIHLFPPNILL